MALMILFIGPGCNMDYRSSNDGGGGSSTSNEANTRLSKILYLKSSDIDVRANLMTDKNGDNVLTLSDGEYNYMYYKFTKRGNVSSDEAASSGTNAAVLAKDNAIFTVADSLVLSSGDYAHGIFSLGEGTSVTVSDCVVITYGRNSSGIITSSGGTANLHHVTTETYGESSPTLYVRSGGGALTAERGKYTTAGANSPVIRSEGDVTIYDAKIEAGKSQAVVVNGKSSVTLISCDITSGTDAKSTVFMYMQDSGNTASKQGSFTMTNGTITSSSDSVFYVTNATANITLSNVELINENENGAFIRAEASDLGTLGANGGNITLYADNQYIDGDIYLDGISDMNMHLTGDSYFAGTINPSGSLSRVYVEITDSKWILTGDSYIESLTCSTNSITLNGHNLYVDGTAYEPATESIGVEIDLGSDRVQDDSDSGDPTSTESGDISEDPSETETPEVKDDPEDPEDPSSETEAYPLSFDVLLYTTGTVNGVSYRAYNDIVYVSSPANEEYQKLSVYIPEPYFNSRPLHGYTSKTAPIFVPNNSSGYMAASIMTPQDTNPVGLALANGLVVVSPALRGRNVTNGTAPAPIVDYKAVIRYIRANKSLIPAGNTDMIIACGVSSGGALSAILGTSGNSTDYDYWLDELGAAEAEDKIYAAVSYCPITNLEYADGAYEWIFGGENYGEDSVNLRGEFESYVNSLGLTHNGIDLEIYEDDEEYAEGFSFRKYTEWLYVQAAQKALDAGTVISADWVNVVKSTVVSADLNKYAESFTVRQKGIPAFDKFDLSSPENGLFGWKHFTSYSAEHSTSGGDTAEYDAISAMNPMDFIGNADTCKYWRIRHGVNDRDITVTIPAILALTLENSGFTVDFSAIWGQGHGGYYDSDELFSWIDSICK